MPFAVYVQELNPLGYQTASTVVAALPVLVLFYLLVGRRWLASWAGAAGAVVAVLVAWLVYGMPLDMASWAFVHGAWFGLLPIGWTVFSAMLLYNVTVETGQFAIIRRSIGGLSGDARVQAVLIGFAFGAFMEGAAGAGSPVAICGAMLVGLGVPPFRAAVICLIANTSPVCYGGLGVPILTLGNVTGIPAETISVMCGHQLPFLSCLVPLYMVKCMCTWRQTLAVWPALLVGGGSFALFQYFFATMHLWVPGFTLWPLTDIGGGLFSLVTLAVFLKFVWKPRTEWKFSQEVRDADRGVRNEDERKALNEPEVRYAKEEVESLLEGPEVKAEEPLTARRVAVAWSPFLLMAACLAAAGWLRKEETTAARPIDLGIARSYYTEPVPTLHKEVERADRLLPKDATEAQRKESALFNFPWLTNPGTPVFAAALVSMVMLRMSRAQVGTVFRKTGVQMKVPIPTIACMLGLSYVTKYAGIDATLGVAFAETGALYPFFAALLGWLGVFLTGTDAGSNALFGSLQKITATEVWNAHHAGAMNHLSLEQAQLLICTANSTGGVMGKMIDAQSICVATAGTNQVGREADIFKAVVWHSVFLACVVGAMTALQAFVPPFTLMVPKP
ncbi:MAG: L-lactate permease [Gemmataceae bacterium]|nr:L-lactate permease [Gemmataceae bacterium]